MGSLNNWVQQATSLDQIQIDMLFYDTNSYLLEFASFSEKAIISTF